MGVAYLLLVVQAFIVVLQRGTALLLPFQAVRRIDDIAAEEFLPERIAGGGT